MNKHTADNIIEGEVVYTRPDFDPLDAFGRLLLGVSLEGVEQFFARLKAKEHQLFDSADYVNVAEDETPVDRLRYLLVGAMFLSQQHVRTRISQTLRVVSVLGDQIRPILRRAGDNWLVKQGWGLVSAEVERPSW